MKVYEIIESKKSNVVNESLLLFKSIWTVLVAMGLWKPISTAWTNMNRAATARNQGTMSDEQLNQVTRQELSAASVSIASILIGNMLIKKLSGLMKVTELFGKNAFAKAMTNIWNTILIPASPAAQYEFMKYVNSEEGAGIIADWIIGNLFIDEIKIAGGDTYEKYVGNGLQTGLEKIWQYAAVVATPYSDPTSTEPDATVVEPDQTTTTQPNAVKTNQVKQKWTDPNEPTYSSSLARNPETGELELK